MSSIFNSNYSGMSDIVLQQQLIKIFNQAKVKANWLVAGVDFFSSTSNLIYAKEVMKFFNRGLPQLNINDITSFALDCQSFYSACRYFKLMGFPFQDIQGNCQLIKDTITVINTEKENVYNTSPSKWGNEEQRVLNSMKTYLEQQQAKLSCNLYLTQSEQQYQIDTMTKVTDAAISSPKSSQDTAVTKYAIYGVIAVIIIMIFIKMFR